MCRGGSQPWIRPGQYVVAVRIRDWGARPSDLYDERIVHIYARLGADMLDPPFPVRSQIIVSQTVRFHINDLLELGLERHPLGRLDYALEDAELDALPVIETGFRYLAQSLLASGRRDGDIVAHQDQHGYLQKKGG